MEYSSDKNVTYGIKNDGDKFRDVRNKAVNEYMDKGKKKKREPKVVVPKFQPGQEIVIVRDGYGKRTPKKYCLVEIVDFEETRDSYKYYGIVLKTTTEDMLERIGRFVVVEECGWFHAIGWQYGKIKNENIHWIEEEKWNRP